MLYKRNNSSPLITIIVNFFNNRREAKRTLYSMSSCYQNIDSRLYNVVAIDNNSTEPLNKKHVSKYGSNFYYQYFKNEYPSPSKAINYIANKIKSKYVVICIDGARILSPGILKWMLTIIKFDPNPFIYTIGMHIGKKPQNFLIEEGYNSTVEDKLLELSEWEKEGYNLFKISSIALSSKNGFFSKITESNCFLIRRKQFIAYGGYNEKFISKGGGLVNLEFFNKIQEDKNIDKYLILGEATFHQFHNGVATNVRINDHPWDKFCKEYEEITKKKYKSLYNQPYYIGWLSNKYHGNMFPINTPDIPDKEQ